MVFWDDLGFTTDYSVDPDPEFPADGNWGAPEVRVGSTGSLLGGPQAVISPRAGAAWVLSTHFTDIGSLYGTPDPDSICVVDRFEQATLVDTLQPLKQTRLVATPISAAAALDEGLLLIADERRVTAFGIAGLAWTSVDLFDRDLHIRRTDNGRIVCRGWDLTRSTTRPVEATLIARTGAKIP
jgi:hypothetical protein